MKILIADDDRSVRDLLQSNLKEWGFDVLSVSSGKEAFRILKRKYSPSLAVLDFSMPDMDMIEICRTIRESGKEKYPYIIILVGKGSHKEILKRLNFEADDYLIKPFNINELRFRLNAGQRIIRYQEELLKEKKNLIELTMYDGLTRLYNRSAIMDMFQKELSRTRRKKDTMSLIMADIDHFKKVNDTYGHLAGDTVLRETARRISDSLRPYDGVGRYGGEDFLIVVPSCDSANAVHLAERIRAKVSGMPVLQNGHSIPVTISLGVSTSNGDSESNSNALIDMADKALYSAKDGGRNCVEQCKGYSSQND